MKDQSRPRGLSRTSSSRVEAHTGALYDRALGREAKSAAPTGSPEAAAGRRELQDGLTEEQRRMLDELGG